MMVFLQKFVQDLFALALHLSVVSTKDSLDFRLCFGGGDEVDPCRTDVLRFRCEDLHLVSALQFMAQRYQFVVHLGAYTVAAEEGVDGEGEVEGCAIGW